MWRLSRSLTAQASPVVSTASSSRIGNRTSCWRCRPSANALVTSSSTHSFAMRAPAAGFPYRYSTPILLLMLRSRAEGGSTLIFHNDGYAMLPHSPKPAPLLGFGPLARISVPSRPGSASSAGARDRAASGRTLTGELEAGLRGGE